MTDARNERFARVAAVALVAAFGTVLLMPTIRMWDDGLLLRWLLYVIACALPIEVGRSKLPASERILLSGIGPLMQIFYFVLTVRVLGHSLSMSGLHSDNPDFWWLAAFLGSATWLFVWVFSHGRGFIIQVVRWFSRRSSDAKLKSIGSTLSALISLLGIVGLLVAKLVQ